MHVDIDVELARDREDAVDLPVRARIRVGRGADHAAAVAQRLDHQLVGAGIVQQPFLRKDADLDVDRPSVFFDQLAYAFEPAQSDAGIDLELRAHMRRAVEDAFLQRLLRARVDVFRGEALLGTRDLLDRFLQIALLGPAAIENARLVEMDMGLDQPGADQPAAEIDRLAVGRELLLDDGDPAALDADIGRLLFGADHSGVSQDQVHVSLIVGGSRRDRPPPGPDRIAVRMPRRNARCGLIAAHSRDRRPRAP